MIKKTVGILTFYNAHNYGAVLQAYALKKKIESLNMECSIICYKNKLIEESYPYNRKFIIKNKSIKGFVKLPIDAFNVFYSKKMYHEKWNKFNKFINELSDNCNDIYTAKNELNNINFDYIICGSDQIWNPILTGGLDGAFFVDFKTKAKKISFAASMGLKKLPEEEEKKFFKLIKNFDYISVREESLKKYINSNYEKEVNVVLDPTLLIDKEEYDDIIENPKSDKKYILVYCLMENRNMVKLAHKIAKEKGLEVIEMRFFKDITYVSHNQKANLSPGEFLGYIKNAEMVISNSFHGTVFSIIFNKLFFTIPLGAVSSRMENLLETLGLSHRLKRAEEDFDINEDIDYSIVNKKLIKSREKSIEFLLKALS